MVSAYNITNGVLQVGEDLKWCNARPKIHSWLAGEIDINYVDSPDGISIGPNLLGTNIVDGFLLASRTFIVLFFCYCNSKR